MNEKNQSSGIIIFCVKTRNFLCVKRSDRVGTLMNVWSIPAGSVEPGETPEECVLREFEEEMSITREVIFQLKKIISLAIPNNGVFNIFLGYVEKEFKPILDLEHTEYRWSKVLPKPNVGDVELIMNQIQSYYGRL